MNNSITIIGYVGKDPVPHTFTSGKTVVKFSVAVKDFNKPENLLWLEVAAWNGNGEKASSLITKGREVCVSGKLTLESYTDKNGNTITKPVILMASFYLCGKKPAEAEIQPVEPEPAQPAVKSRKTVKA